MKIITRKFSISIFYDIVCIVVYSMILEILLATVKVRILSVEIIPSGHCMVHVDYTDHTLTMLSVFMAHQVD